VLAPARAAARRDKMRLYLAGGAVRDLLLGRPVRDIDLVIMGDVPRFARELSRALGAADARLHERFDTATLLLSDGRSVDVARARTEVYDRPGALPHVTRSDRIEDDLFRRDFTINAMAIEIGPGRKLRLVDPYGGQPDLARRQIEILHPGSFRDDPTRALRAVRYAARLGFTVGAQTRRALRGAIRDRFFESISGERLRREIELLLSEERRANAVQWMGRLGLADAIDPALRVDSRVAARIRRAEAMARRLRIDGSWLAYLLAWAGPMTASAAKALAERLRLAGTAKTIVLAWPARWKKLRASQRLTSSAVADLRLTPEEQLAALVLLPEGARRHLVRSLESSPLRLAITGTDLLRAGLAPGPEIGRALARTLAARRDGMIASEQELDFALGLRRQTTS
jgi:tRNA nucleotidyltransferase (CCA-adding enzyme)